jgi:protein-tyrosine-phosphatase
MKDEPKLFNVLFLSTRNSARSTIAECILNRLGAGRFRAYSAGSQAAWQIRPETLSLLKTLNYDVSALRSKSWDEFAEPGAPHLDFVFTVCDDAAGEECPYWPGQPMTAHWGIPDPARATGSPSQISLAFADTYRMLNNRISVFAALPFRTLDSLALKRRLDEIGQSEDAKAASASAA